MTDVVAATLDISGNIDINGTTNLDVVDIDGAVNMATTALVTGVLTTTAATVFNGGFASNAASTITTADNSNTLSLVSTDADASSGPNLRMYRNSGSPADVDEMGNILFVGRNDNSQDVTYGEIEVYAMDVSDGSEDGLLNINTITAGSNVSRIKSISGETVFNDDSVDVDFRVESNGNQHMLFVDGGNDHVNIGTSTDLGGVFNVSGATSSQFHSTDRHLMSLVSTEAGASDGPRLILQRDSSSPADNDQLGILEFYGENDADEAVEYARINASIIDASDGTEDGAFAINTRLGGANVNRLYMPPTETVFNEHSADLDFRVESDSNGDCFFVDAGNEVVTIKNSGGAFNGVTAQSLHVRGSTAGNTTPIMMVTDSDDSVEADSELLHLAFTNDSAFATAIYVRFNDQGGVQGSISGEGTGSVAFNTSSDERLKENIVDTESKWDVVKSLQVRDYKWKKSDKVETGFIAQELNEKWSDPVLVGGDDETRSPWSVDYGRLTPLLTKALQEAMKKIEELETKVAALEG
jgi:hypothetical protein